MRKGLFWLNDKQLARIQPHLPLTYLKGYADGSEAKDGIARWIAFYNEHRLRGVALTSGSGRRRSRFGFAIGLSVDVPLHSFSPP
ncbi:hypothetical protein [Bradyrhizobium sp. Leo170]|uniref:hypothetical protein n=1 Tax=Bradyrhizobium sp. Leo170 TaxID=1571199 RepID=UPI00102EB85C|nr:hypothetical protein [Bradyrhizobium sp. Leo170]TAI60219.1 hypothetical protein CWO89_41900 [Bradyrhizobium sp. Leo170]